MASSTKWEVQSPPFKEKIQPNDIIRLKMTRKDGEKEEENAIKLQDIFKKTDEQMTIVFGGCPGSGKTALTLGIWEEYTS